MLERKDGVETRKRILGAASLEFGRKGFRDTTVADICRLAGTNIASVNYHFGDKERLYVEAWRQSFQRSHELHPPDGDVPDGASPEERLRGWICSTIARVVDTTCHDFEIIHKEMANPTGLLAEAMRTSVEPIQRILAGILRDLLGEKASDEDIRLCEMSVHSQCVNPRLFAKRFRTPEKKRSLSGPPFPDLDPEMIADHVTRFSLAGLGEVRRHIETRESGRK